jgi:hypothetical protein
MAILDTSLLTNLTTAIGRAHVAYIRAVGANREDDDGNEVGPFYWLQLCKSLVRGGNDLQSGIISGSAIALAAQGSATFTVNLTGGNMLVNGQTVAVSTNATYGSSAIFSQTCTDGSALASGQFYYAALCCDHLGVLSVLRGPREDRPDAPNSYPMIPSGLARIAWIKVNYSASTSVINTADITLGQTLTSYAAPANDAIARMFGDFDAGQTKMVSKSAVKSELGFALTSLNTYVKTATIADGLNSGAGYTDILSWAKSTHQTGSPWDFPAGFVTFVRALRGGKDPSQRLATISFTGSGTATVTDLKKVVGLQDKLELVVTSASATGAAASTIAVTVQVASLAIAQIYNASVPANTPNGTVIAMTAGSKTSTQTPIVGTAANTGVTNSNTLLTQSLSPTLYTALVPSSPVAVTGGTNADAFAVRNVGTL